MRTTGNILAWLCNPGLPGVLAASLALGCGPASESTTVQQGESLPLAQGSKAQLLSNQVDEYIQPLLQHRDFNGIVLLGNRDSILVLRSYGLANYETGSTIVPATKFGIASVTKTFTAGAILTLAHQGALDLEDPLSRFAPEFPRAAEITVRLLLRHESGVGNPDYLESFEPSDRPLQLEELVETIAAQPFLFGPGAANRYSNAGFNLLAWVVQQASGMPYDEFLERRFFQPLGMTGSGQFLGTELPASHAVGYLPAPGPSHAVEAPYSNLGFSIGSGALSSTAPDLWRWARAVADETLFEWKGLEWPYGWGKVEIGGHDGLEQTGAITGFMSNLLVFPEADLFVVVLYNKEFGGWIRVGRDLAAVGLGESYDPPAVHPRIDTPLEGLHRFVGSYESQDMRLRIEAEDGHLWLYSGEWPIGKYIVPVSENVFTVPSDVGEIRFGGPVPSGEYGELTWDFGNGATTYYRSGR